MQFEVQNSGMLMVTIFDLDLLEDPRAKWSGVMGIKTTMSKVKRTCNGKDDIVKACNDGKSFVAQDPNRGCKYTSCPD